MTTFAPNPTVGADLDTWGTELNTRLDDLQDHIVTLEDGDAGGAGAQSLMARSYGLGDGTTSDDAALAEFFAQINQPFTELGLDRAGLGVKGILPAGVWGGSALGHPILAPATSVGGDIIVAGQGAGSTTLTVLDRGTSRGIKLGCMNSAQILATGTRSGNTFTLGFTGPWFPVDPTTGAVIAGAGTVPAPTSAKPLCQVFDMIWVKVLSEGVLAWAAYTVTANNVAGDYTKIQYNAHAPGMATDGCIPPVGSGQLAYFVGGYLLQPLNFKNPHCFRLRDLTLKSGSNTRTPLDGFGIRRSSGAFIGKSVALVGWFANECINGSAMPSALAQGPQNTDHSNSSASYSNAQYNCAYVTNSQSGGSRVDNVGGSTRSPVGGTRDTHFRAADMSAPDLAHFFIADDAEMSTCDISGMNLKSGQYDFFGAGIAGIPCVSTEMIDALWGVFKIESPFNGVFEDRSLTRTVWAFNQFGLRFEAGIAINGIGTNVNGADQPYHLTNVTISGSPGSGGTSAVMTATISETVHGLGVGVPVQTGNGGPNTTLVSTGANSMVGVHFGSGLPGTIHCTDLTGFPSFGQVLIGSNRGTQLVTYTGITGNDLTGCTGGEGNAMMQANGGITSQALAHEGAIASLDATGQIITIPIPDYVGPNITTAATCTLGRIFFVRCGTFDRADGQYDWDVTGGDRYVQGCMHFSVQHLGATLIRMTQNDISPAPRNKLPVVRVRDFEGIGGTHAACAASKTINGVAWTKVLSSTETEFNQSDVGKTVVCANVAGGTDTIAAFIDINNVQMTGAVTAGTGLTWAMNPFTNLPDPGFEIQRGALKYRLCHAGTSASALLAGHVVELDTSSGTLGGNPSAAVKGKACIGVAMQPRPANHGRVTVTTSGTGGTGLVIVNSSSFLVLKPAGVVNVSDPVQLVATAAITTGDTVIDDGATNPGQVKTAALTAGVINANQRVLGQAMSGTGGGGGTIAIALETPYWT